MGKAADGTLVTQRQRTGEGTRAQKRKPRRDAWTKAQQALFLATLADTCNASEAARAAGKCRAGAYRRRATDPGFAQAWDAALEAGYAEIELMLMRAALFGTEAEEVTTDADGAVKARKVKRAPNLAVALRLFLAYRDKVARIRGQAGAPGAGLNGAGRSGAGQNGAGRPDGPDAVAQVEAVMAEIGRRRAAAGV